MLKNIFLHDVATDGEERCSPCHVEYFVHGARIRVWEYNTEPVVQLGPRDGPNHNQCGSVQNIHGHHLPCTSMLNVYQMQW